MRHVQVPTVLSLLTEEYRKRVVQETYHHGHTNKPMWPSQYCWPEGFMRRWHEWAAYDRQVMVTPQMVQIYMSGAMNFVTNIHVGRAFKMDGPVPRLGEQVPRWYGETVGFWDRDALITWTSNVQAWTSHTAFEHSGKMQSIEIYTPLRDAERTVHRAEPRGHPLRSGGAGGTLAHRAAHGQARRLRRSGREPHRVHRVHPDHLSR